MLINSLVSHFYLMKFLLLFLLLITTNALASQDDDFLAARDAFRAGDAAKLSTLALRLQHSPLEVYTAYYQLKMRLDTIDPGVIREYLARPDDTPLIDRMRADWLRILGKKQQWELFDSEYPRLISEDAELTCYALQSRLRSQETSVLREARELWFSAKDQPESCAVLFEMAIVAGVISQQDIWQRERMALEAVNVQLAKSLAVRLTGNRAISPAALDRAMSDPARYLEKLTPDSQGGRAVALFALQRLAHQSPDLALGRWKNMAVHFTDVEQHYFLGWLAYEAARKHDARALQWFKEAGNTQLNPLQFAWRVRAALRVQDWPDVLSAINAMNEVQRGEAVWRYWRARALQVSGHRAEAVKIFVPLSAEHTFYGQLAAEELADMPMLSAVQPAYQATRQDIAAIEQLPGVRRTL
ncbi:MAG TPA: transglycosylase, partial [Gallionella sp.]